MFLKPDALPVIYLTVLKQEMKLRALTSTRKNHPLDFVSDIAIFVLKRGVKLQLTNSFTPLASSFLQPRQRTRDFSAPPQGVNTPYFFTYTPTNLIW